MKKITGIMTAAVLCILLAACNRPPAQPTGTASRNTDASEAEKLLNSMTLEEKVWQMFFVMPEDIIDGVDPAIRAGDATRQAVESYPAGGIIYFGKNIESREQISEMIANTQSYSKIPLFISTDEEGGRVARLGNAGIIEKQPLYLYGAAKIIIFVM